MLSDAGLDCLWHAVRQVQHLARGRFDCGVDTESGPPPRFTLDEACLCPWMSLPRVYASDRVVLPPSRSGLEASGRRGVKVSPPNRPHYDHEVARRSVSGQYDLLLRGGEVVDPSSGVRGTMDIAIVAGRIVGVQPDLDAGSAARVLDVTGSLVTPGLIDLHTHVYPEAMPGAIDADLAGVKAGVTTVVDAGSSGPHTFEGFKNHVIPKATTRIVPFLNIARSGLAFRPEIRAEQDIAARAAVQVIEESGDLIRGIKVRAIGPAVAVMGLELFLSAKRVADECDLPIMVHIGETEVPGTPTLTRALLPLLDSNDILTHAFTPHEGGILEPDGSLLPEAKDAFERGVIFDVAHGVRNFSFETARRLLDHGIVPHCISTDMALRPRQGSCKSLLETMSKFLALGVPLEAVIRMTTTNPSTLLGDSAGTGALEVGSEANISVLELVEGAWDFEDSLGAHFRGTTALKPVITIRNGTPISPDWGPHPWGWLPATADS